jgi:hypothetical protein
LRQDVGEEDAVAEVDGWTQGIGRQGRYQHPCVVQQSHESAASELPSARNEAAPVTLLGPVPPLFPVDHGMLTWRKLQLCS